MVMQWQMTNGLQICLGYKALVIPPASLPLLWKLDGYHGVRVGRNLRKIESDAAYMENEINTFLNHFLYLFKICTFTKNGKKESS